MSEPMPPDALANEAPAQALSDADAALVALCAEHLGNMAALNADDGAEDIEHSDVGRAYFRTRDAIVAAEPRTLAGIVALARVAKAEAALPDGREIFAGSCALTIAENVLAALAAGRCWDMAAARRESD